MFILGTLYNSYYLDINLLKMILKILILSLLFFIFFSIYYFEVFTKLIVCTVLKC